MTAAAAQEPSIPFRECTLRAVVLTPQRPVANWLVRLDGSVQEHQEKLLARAVLLDVSALQPRKAELRALLARLDTRHIRIMAVAGVDPAWLGPGMPPVLDADAHAEIAEQAGAGPRASAPASQVPVRVIEGAVRSGQSVVLSEGDLTIDGS